ncbi:MAG: SUMF1/EgtB/PvdO family nonheme iron enzyme [Deltaproteobacteria bacterium]|nr:SUMF1/EgtB/PvdO family nonheme iron enzyme [Deltaproteobacteria bacterium]
MMRRALASVGALVLASATSCSRAVPEAPPLPEALVVVDTDLPVPLVASRLRVDLFSRDGTWFDSADFGRPDPRDWPASFSVYSEDESREREVWVRLRIYPEGAVDSYRGKAKLVRDGIDVTPATEPSPAMTVDRLLLVPLRPQTRGRVRALLTGACVGSSSLGAEGAPRPGAASCVATTGEVSEVAVAALEDDMSRPTTTAAGTWLAKPCPPDDGTSKRVCIPGGATILGSRENSDYTPTATNQLDPSPPRVFGLSPFEIDRDEVTVGEVVTIADSGYSGALPIVNDAPLAAPVANSQTGCTFSFNLKDRADYPVTCVSRRAARAICQFRGGDLPTEAQWEHVATIAGHRAKTRYPWGPETPTCDRAVYGRVPLERAKAECPGDTTVPKIRTAPADVSALGVHDLYGNVVEWMLDDAAPYTDARWQNAGLVDPKVEGDGPRGVIRGSSWLADRTRPIFRITLSDIEPRPIIGFRCAYPRGGR